MAEIGTVECEVRVDVQIDTRFYPSPIGDALGRYTEALHKQDRTRKASLDAYALHERAERAYRLACSDVNARRSELDTEIRATISRPLEV